VSHGCVKIMELLFFYYFHIYIYIYIYIYISRKMLKEVGRLPLLLKKLIVKYFLLSMSTAPTDFKTKQRLEKVMAI
jgi:hypothetical protein